MKIGDFVNTPRFMQVKISEMFDDETSAKKEGFYEPTHYDDPDCEIFGKHTGENRMIFAAIKKQRR